MAAARLLPQPRFPHTFFPPSPSVEEVKEAFAKFGPVRDVYIPKDMNTREPRGFAFIEFEDEADAACVQSRTTSIWALRII